MAVLMSTYSVCFLWRNKQNYPLIITKYPSYLFHWIMWLSIIFLSAILHIQTQKNKNPKKWNTFEPPRDKTKKVGSAPSEDSDQPGHLPSLIRVFTVRMKKAWFLSYPLNTQRRLWSDWADAQADLSLCWVHLPFCWFYHEVAHFTWSQWVPTFSNMSSWTTVQIEANGLFKWSWSGQP